WRRRKQKTNNDDIFELLSPTASRKDQICEMELRANNSSSSVCFLSKQKIGV
ncbi:unnamed protein product, partial [Musa acuminata var. zebrina]